MRLRVVREGERMKIPTSVLLVLVVGCFFACVPQEVKQEVRDMAATSAADDRDWPTLTEKQRAQCVHDYASWAATINYALNGVPIPAAYATAPVASASKAAGK